MNEVLLINPRKRRKATVKRKAAPKRRRARRANPAPVVSTLRRVTRRRRANPLSARRVSRRRRNPIGGGAGLSAKSIMVMLRESVIGGAGAVGVDYLMAQLGPKLPASLRITSGKPGAGHAVKALLTILAGKLLKKPTKGLSEKMAQGALTVQVAQVLGSLLPAQTASVGYYTPTRVVNGSNRVGPIRPTQGVGEFLPRGASPVLQAFLPQGTSPVLRTRSTRQRQGMPR